MKPKFLDIAACLLVLVLALFSAFPFLFTNNGEYLVITSDDGTVTIPLSQNDDHVLSSNGEELTVTVKNGEAYVSAHTCRDGLCAKTGRISRSGESIVCLPARISVTVTKKSSESEVTNIDGIAG